jgi:hypothetical protein
MFMYFGNALVSMKRGALAPPNPWDGDSLEWATTSPPPPYNFLHLPVVNGREPLWHQPELAPVVTGLATDKRELLITRVLDAEPDHRYVVPAPTVWPFMTALATGIMFVALLFTPWAMPIGLVVATACATAWFWPTSKHKEGEAP